tara:strand:- start:22 stop:963 length:942 start_codon:yes stop_codon:yes gene_type:complete
MNDSTSPEGIETDTAVDTEESYTETIDDDVEDSQEDLDEDEGGYSDDDDDSDEDVPEYREYDFGGKKYQINKNEPLSDEQSEQFESYGKGLQSDYTKKTQELAEQKKHIEAREQSAEKLLSLQGDTLDIYSQGLAIRQELAQLNEIDLNQLWQSNPDQARQVSDAISQKTKEFNATVQQVSAKEGEMAHTKQADRQAREMEGEKALNARIPQFTEKVGEVIDYFCKTFGADKKATEAGWRSDPVVTELAYKAMMFDKMKAKVKKGSKVNPATATESKPVKGKGGRHKSNTPTDKDSSAAWLAKRNAQLRKRTG